MSTLRNRARRHGGFSLIELLVSMVIALVVTLAISSVMIRSEGGKRTTTSVNDVNQTALYLSYMLDRTIRNAGSGFSQRWKDAYGCVLDASKAGAAIMPAAAAWPSPFNNMPQALRLAPVLVAKGLADGGGQVRGDVITVMAGTSGNADMPQLVRPASVIPGAPSTLRVTNTLGYDNSDLVLLADQGVGAGCMLQQVAPTNGVNGDQLTFTGGDYSRNNGSVVNLGAFGGSTYAFQIGTIPGNAPQFQMIAVGDNSTLTSLDLLRQGAVGTTPAATATPIADGVIEMRALYGIDTSAVPDNVIDAWIDPVAGSGYSFAELTAGTPAAQTSIRRIVAVKMGFILRTSTQERVNDRYYGQYAANFNPAGLPSTTITLFSDLPAALRQTRTIVGADNLYRYRTVEFTVPLRNSLYAPVQ